MALTRTSGPTGIRTMGERHSPLTAKLIADGLKAQPLSGRMGLLAGALRDIANDMPGVRAVHKRTAMRELAKAALAELARTQSTNGQED